MNTPSLTRSRSSRRSGVHTALFVTILISTTSVAALI